MKRNGILFQSVLLSFFLNVNESRAMLVVPSVADVNQTTDYSCGPSAMEAVLRYYGFKTTEAEMMIETQVSKEYGASIAPMMAVANRRGIKTKYVENASLQDLETALAKKQLAVILIQAWQDVVPLVPWANEWDSGHYLVVIGIDENNVYFEDPSLPDARASVPRLELLTRWHCWDDKDVKAFRQVIFFEGKPSKNNPSLNLPFQKID